MASLTSHFFRLLMGRSTSPLGKGMSVDEIRSRTERLSRWLRLPRGARVQRVKAGGVPAEWVIPKGAAEDRVLLYIHGGAWVFCSPHSHRGIVYHLAKAGGLKALSLDYRLAPEFPFPAALEDCMAAYGWLLKQGIDAKKIVIAGDSAGGNLTLATLLALRDANAPLPAAAVCLSPATDLATSGKKAPNKTGQDPVLKSLSGRNFVKDYVAGHDPRDPLISPIYGDLHGLPPILIHVGSDEMLLDECVRFGECARKDGVDARVVVWESMWHVFQMAAPFMPEARQSLQQMGEFIREKV